MWRPESDAAVRNHVECNGLRLWGTIAESLGNGAKARQVRDRWVYHLDPSLNHGPWSPEEDARLDGLYRKSKGSWSTMALSLPGRTDVAVKNRWIVSGKKVSDIEMSLEDVDGVDLAIMFGKELADAPVSPASCKKRKSEGSPVQAHAKKPLRLPTPPPCSTTGMRKVTLDGTMGVKTFGAGALASFSGINAMLAKQPDARKQKWGGLGRF